MSGQSPTGGENGGGENKLVIDALMSEMKRILSAKSEQIHERIDKMEQSKEPSSSNVVG